MAERVFVGRGPELKRVADWSQNPSERLLLNHYGIAGIGKSSLLCEIADRYAGSCAVVDLRHSEIQFRKAILRRIAESVLPDSKKQEFLDALRCFGKGAEHVSHAARAYGERARHSAEAHVDIGSGATIGGNVTAQVSIIDNTPSALLLEQHEQNISEATDSLLRLLTESTLQKPLLLLFDHVERVQKEVDLIAWILDTFCSVNSPLANIPIGVIFFGRERITTGSGHSPLTYERLPNLSKEACVEYLTANGLEDAEIRQVILDLTKGHPYCMFLAVEAFGRQGARASNMDPDLLREDTEQMLIAEYLTSQIVENEEDQDIREALTVGAVFRFLNSSNLCFLLSWSTSRAMRVLHKLEKRALLIPHGKVWFFHDILAELLLRRMRSCMSSADYIGLHSRAVSYYDQLGSSGKPSSNEWLICLVEPLYHRLQIDEGEAFSYFENAYKPRLDRRQRDVCQILVSQIDLAQVRDRGVEAWFRFRIADFFREFGRYQTALDMYHELLNHFIPVHRLHDARLETSIHNNIGWAYLFHDPQENRQRATDSFETARQMANRHGLRLIEAMSLNNLGIVWGRQSGSIRKADACLRQSLAITEEGGMRTDPAAQLVAGMSHQNRAGDLAGKGNREEAKREYDAAYQCYRRASADHQQNEVIGIYTHILLREERYPEARRVYQDLWRYWQSHLEHHHLADTLFHAGVCHEALDELELMGQAHALLCKSSLLESLLCHQHFVTHKVTPFMAYLQVKRGGQALLSYSDAIISSWGEEGPFDQITLFPDYLRQRVEEISGSRFYASGKGRCYHRLGCPNSRRVRWFTPVALSKAENRLSDLGRVPCQTCLGGREA